MLILLHRQEYTHRWGGKSYFNRIGLDQLTLKSSAELVKAILEGGETAPELTSLILNRAAGNPLFMEELTHSLLENGSIQMKDKQFVLAVTPLDLQVPDTIQGIIAARIDRLEEDLKKIMQVASVIGREFAFRILQAISGMREDLKSQLLNLQGLEFIYEKSLFPELEYIFKHALTQEVTYNSLLSTRRKEIHKRIGSAIEEIYASSLEEYYEVLAYHYSRSEDLSKAIHYLKLSGDKARNHFSTSEAFRFYQEAVTLLRNQPATPDNRRGLLDILQPMAYPIRILGHREGSLKFLEEGETLAHDLEDRKALAHFQSHLGIYYLTRGGDPVKGRAYIERGLGASGLTEEVEIIVPATSDLISAYAIEGNFYRVCEVAPKVIDLIEKTNTQDGMFGRPSNPYSILLGYYGQSLGAMGRFAEGQTVIDKGLCFARDLNNLFSLALIEMLAGSFYFFKGDAENQIAHYRSAVDYMEKIQFAIFMGPVWAWLGWAYLFSGQMDTALQCAEKGLKLHTDLGTPFFLGSIHLVLSEIHLELGNLDKALLHAEQAVDLCRKNNEKFFLAAAMIDLGRVTAAIDRMNFEKTLEFIQQGLSLADELQIRPYYAVGLLRMGEIYADSGQKEAAIEKLKRAEEMFQEMGMDYWLGKTQEVLAAL